MSKYTDTEMIDFLERENAKQRYTGTCIFRDSSTGRGWRLHETELPGASYTVREALESAMEESNICYM